MYQMHFDSMFSLPSLRIAKENDGASCMRGMMIHDHRWQQINKLSSEKQTDLSLLCQPPVLLALYKIKKIIFRQLGNLKKSGFLANGGYGAETDVFS